MQDQRRDEGAATASLRQPARAGEQSPTSAVEPTRSLAKWSAFEGERAVAVAARGTKRHRRPTRVHGDHDQDDDERVPDAGSRLDSAEPMSTASDRYEMYRLASTRIPASASAARCSAFAVPVRVTDDRPASWRRRRRTASAAPPRGRFPSGCLRDEAEAPAREPGGELQRDEARKRRRPRRVPCAVAELIPREATESDSS